MTTERRYALGPAWFLPRGRLVAVPLMPKLLLADGTYARSALVGNVDGRWVAYANVCRHLAIPLDLAGDGEVMDPTGTELQCHHHGAYFEMRTGACTVGPCFGKSLWPLTIVETHGDIEIVVAI